MPDILVRGLKPGAINRLKARTKRHGRSLQGEAKLLLEGAAGAEMLAGWKKTISGRKLASSVDLIREDRDR